VKKEGEKVRFAVTDNGIGIEPERLTGLKASINNSDGEKGYGLYNVNKRLKLYYGLTDGIEIESEFKKGTKVSFLLDV
jgi:two-component system sensor histidine kinase YesM